MKNQISTLPLYIQKIIIKILCKFINENNKVLDVLGANNYRDKEIKIKKLILKLALVSHSWFNTLSNNLDVSVDFNYGNSQYSILKIENVKSLKLHFDHNKNSFYRRNVEGENEKVEILIPLNTVIQQLEKLKSSPLFSFENLIIRNINITHPNSIINLLNSMQINNNSNNYNKNNNYTETKLENKRILEFFVHKNFTIKEVNQLENLKVRKIFCIQHFGSFEILNELLKIYGKKLNQLIFRNNDILGFISQIKADGSDSNELLPCFKTLFSLNKNKSIVFNTHNFTLKNNHLNIFGMELRLKDIENLINFKNDCLESLSLYFCFKNLCSFLLTSNSKTSSPPLSSASNSSSLSQPPKSSDISSRCSCNSIMKKGQNNSDFNRNWDSLIESFKANTKNLKHLDFSHDCLYFGLLHNFPILFYKGIAKLLNSIPCLESFSSFSFYSPSLLINELFSLSSTTPEKPCSITKFTFYIYKQYNSQTQITQCIQSINHLLQRHQSITFFKLYQLDFDRKLNNYVYELLFDFVK
ncbi:hypothetical protein RB653_010323 [Dictyostelium firmibasis]|uniref:Uncharacterized protein n=1 Tax=Dictyostelium firmibasis TaxID=79012 RepID=A0AAN7TTK4_9MYCE